MDDKNDSRLSQSLFGDGSENAHSLKAASELNRQLRARRTKLFMRFGLPALVVLFILICIFLWKPVAAIFAEPPAMPLPPDPAETLKQQQEAAAKPAADNEYKCTGNPKARMVIEIRTDSPQAVPEGTMSILADAIAQKPSELLLKVAVKPEYSFQMMLINGKDKFDLVEEDGTHREIDLCKAREKELKECLFQAYRNIYGLVLHPLEPQVSEHILHERQEEAEHAIPRVVADLPDELDKNAKRAAESDYPVKDALVLPQLKADLSK